MGAIRQEKGIKETQIGREEVKLFVLQIRRYCIYKNLKSTTPPHTQYVNRIPTGV